MFGCCLFFTAATPASTAKTATTVSVAKDEPGEVTLALSDLNSSMCLCSVFVLLMSQVVFHADPLQSPKTEEPVTGVNAIKNRLSAGFLKPEMLMGGQHPKLKAAEEARQAAEEARLAVDAASKL